jgi:hypothetical protein
MGSSSRHKRRHQQVPHGVHQPERQMHLPEQCRASGGTDQQRKKPVAAVLGQCAGRQRQADA